MESIAINNNIKIHYIPMTKLKTTSVGVYIHRPLCEKDVSYNALLPMVLKHASEKFPSREAISRHLDNLYGATMGATNLKLGEDQVIYFDAETISDKYCPDNAKLLSGLLELLMSVIFEPKTINGGFDTAILSQEKKDAIDRIDAFINDKRQYASTRCISETARGTAFALNRLGKRDEIEKITEKELYDYYKSVITSSVIDIYICGDTDIDSAAKTVSDYVGKIAFQNGVLPKTDIIKRNTVSVNTQIEKIDVTQGKLSLGFLTNTSPVDDDYPALIVFNSVFGAGAHSKLFNNVREKLSLAYYASSSLEKYKGILTVNSGIEFENYQKAYDEILLQLEEIRNGNISEHEFTSSINTLINSCNSYYDDQRALATFLLMEEVAGSNRTIEDLILAIKKVTLRDVVEVSKKLQLDTVYFLTGKEE